VLTMSRNVAPCGKLLIKGMASFSSTCAPAKGRVRLKF